MACATKNTVRALTKTLFAGAFEELADISCGFLDRFVPVVQPEFGHQVLERWARPAVPAAARDDDVVYRPRAASWERDAVAVSDSGLRVAMSDA